MKQRKRETKNKDETEKERRTPVVEGRDKEKKIGEKLRREEHSLYKEEKDQALITPNHKR